MEFAIHRGLIFTEAALGALLLFFAGPALAAGALLPG